jgi:hypothetical protein
MTSRPPNHENVLNDFREGFVSWQPHDGIYLDLGRINLRSGAALGFNPTDCFKSRAVVEPLSADPSVLREDRLGRLQSTITFPEAGQSEPRSMLMLDQGNPISVASHRV